MARCVAMFICGLASLGVTFAKPGEKSFELPYSEAWQEQLLERGREFTAEHHLSPGDFDTIVLDANGAKVRRGQTPDADNFPLRVKFVPKSSGAAPKRSFTLEYSEKWKDEMSKQMNAFGEEHGAKLDQIGVSVVDAEGENVKHGDNPAADRFPIKIVFQLPTKPGSKPASKPDQQAPRMTAKGGPEGFKLQYSEDWKQVMGKKMTEFGKMYGVTPDKFWPHITDKEGANVESGAEVPEVRFPLNIAFVPRDGKPLYEGNGGEGGPPLGNLVDMSADIRCDFCELASKRIASSLSAAATFKRSDDILAKVEDFCEGADGEDGIGDTLLNEQYFVFWNSTRPNDAGKPGRWNLMHLDVGQDVLEGEKVEDMVDPKFKENMRVGIAGACEKTVDEHQVELSEKLFKQFKKSKPIDAAAVHKTLCVSLSRACTNAGDGGHKADAETRTDL